MTGSLKRFVGVWEWDYSRWDNGSGTKMTFSDTVDYRCSVEITSKGELYTFRDGVQIDKFNLKVLSREYCKESDGYCEIELIDNPFTDIIAYLHENQIESIAFNHKSFPAPNPPLNYYIGRHYFRKAE